MSETLLRLLARVATHPLGLYSQDYAVGHWIERGGIKYVITHVQATPYPSCWHYVWGKKRA